MSALARTIKLLWAAPCTAVGLAPAAAVLLFGGRARLTPRAIEVAWRDSPASCGQLARRLPYRAITLGHVVIAVTRRELDALRSHELVHVEQYERWGALFFLAYPASGAWQWLAGRNAYWDNPFEIQARVRSAERDRTASSA
jgi:hypothetical protein